MPSPFPGMDPYLEAPDIWPDFHDAFASEIRGILNARLPAPYYARLEMRPEVGIIGEFPRRRMIPDVSVNRPELASTGGVAVAETARSDVSESYDVVFDIEKLRHHYVEIRDSKRSHELVTLIEIVSPSNKRPGTDRDDYLAKQREVLSSDASLIEIDLLRTGTPIVGAAEVIDTFLNLDPPAQYAVTVNRAWKRGVQGSCELFPFTLRQPLPCIPVPLREGEEEVPLDLQFVFRKTYDAGPYLRGLVDYERPPEVPLTRDDDVWAADCVRRALHAGER